MVGQNTVTGSTVPDICIAGFAGIACLERQGGSASGAAALTVFNSLACLKRWDFCGSGAVAGTAVSSLACL